MHRHQLSYSGITLAVLLVCLIAINVVAFFIPLRWDVTEENVYSISDGTLKILESLEEPLTIKFYFSKSNEELPLHFKAYGQRISEFLEEYVYLSKGLVKLEVFDPQPDSEEEEWAQKYGIQQVALPSGSTLYFGMVAIMLDQEVAVPVFDLRRESFLEYDISQAILKVSTSVEVKIGLLTSMNLMGGAGFPPGAQQEPKWAFISELERTFKIENLPLSTEEIMDDIGLLIVFHPKDFSDRLHYAIDQYVMRGGRVIALVDPNSREDARTSPGAQYGQMPKVTSNLGTLFGAWGIEFNPSKLVGDFKNATPVNTGSGGVIRYPLWMTFGEEALDSENPITLQLENIFMAEAGAFTKREQSDVEFTPLISTSVESGLLDSFVIRFSPPDKIIKDLKPDQTVKALAALVRGPFKSAYPGGQPAKAEPKPGESSDSEKSEPLKHPHLSLAKDPNTVLVVGDTDFISDAFSVQRFNFLGQTIIQPANDNLNFILNAVEFLSGNDALMSVRSRGRFSRPFTKLKELEQKAQVRFQSVENELQQKLDAIGKQLESLQQQGQGASRKIILTPEIQAKIEQFREDKIATQKKLREVRKILRQDIEDLGNLLLMVNLLAIPILVAIAGIISTVRRSKKRRRQA